MVSRVRWLKRGTDGNSILPKAVGVAGRIHVMLRYPARQPTAVLLACVLVLLLSGCGGNEAATPTSTAREGAVATASRVPPASAPAPTSPPHAPPSIATVALPDGVSGIGFDDLRYDAVLGRVLVRAWM
jgi:hypothetical protein